MLSNRLGDPETPYAGAQRTAKLLGNARLLTLDTFGHGSLNKSTCVDAAVDRYLMGGRLPAPDKVSPPDYRPFR